MCMHMHMPSIRSTCRFEKSMHKACAYNIAHVHLDKKCPELHVVVRVRHDNSRLNMLILRVVMLHHISRNGAKVPVAGPLTDEAPGVDKDAVDVKYAVLVNHALLGLLDPLYRLKQAQHQCQEVKDTRTSRHVHHTHTNAQN